ncbi:MAG: hypothetical protein RL266_662 [Bacteroidota bacterium]
MKKSVLIVAVAFLGTSAFAQQAPQNETLKESKSPQTMVKKSGKKLNVGTSAVLVAEAKDAKSLWVPIGPAMRSEQK